METLHDIHPIELESFSIYGYIFLFLILFLVVSLVLVFLIKNKKKQKLSLVSKNFFNKETKQLCYDFTLFAQANTNEKFQKELEDILQRIEKYKYHNKKMKLKPSLIEEMKEYIKKLEVDKYDK
jgi:hypothetical protein